jgi:hypothetical protein
MKTPAFLVFVAIVCFTSVSFAKEEPKISTPLRFVPDGGAWKGETPTKGASWTAFGPGMEKNSLFLQGRAGVGDKFPVQDKSGTALFEIKLVEGDDDRLVVEVQSKSGNKKLELPRDRSAEVTISGTNYELLYPTITVAATPTEKPSTNKATVLVIRRLK